MGFWNRRVGDNSLTEIEDLSYPPNSGGRVKMTLLGFLLPLGLILYALHAWHTGRTWLPGRNGNVALTDGGVTLTGPGAQWLALSYFAAGLAAHFRWFWGLRSAYRIFEWGSTAAMILWISGCSGMVYYEFIY